MPMTLTDQLTALVQQAGAGAATLPGTQQVQQHAKAAEAFGRTLNELWNTVRGHAQRTRQRVAQVQLEIARWSPATPGALQAHAKALAEDVNALLPAVQAKSDETARHRSVLAADSGALTQQVAQARARLKQLEQQKAELQAKANELRNRSIWTWLFPLAKAIDELVALGQYGKSTEAAREASELIRASDLASGQVAVLDQMTVRLQALHNQLSVVSARLRSEESLAKFDSPQTAGVFANVLMHVAQALEHSVD
jgi:hypothetical protein